jgi:hypothetical protein
MDDENIAAQAFLQCSCSFIPLQALPVCVSQPGILSLAKVATTSILVKSMSGRGEWNITKRDWRGREA